MRTPSLFLYEDSWWRTTTSRSLNDYAEHAYVEADCNKKKEEENKKKEVPSVVHTDGTGRIHFVSEESNSIFYKLIKEFQKKSNVPIILNNPISAKIIVADKPPMPLSCIYPGICVAINVI